jgi:hypothetical protein
MKLKNWTKVKIEEFPEKWCLKITKESLLFIHKVYKDLKCCLKESDFNYNYLKSDHCFAHRSIKNPSKEYPEITLEQFKKHILKESTTMKNLLETEFVIENCTLSQRLAIKAYCDEKKIEYVVTLLEMCSKNVFWNKKMFLQTSTLEYTKITFSELIQFLDQYQPEPEFKVGDIVVVESWHHTENIEFPQTCELVGVNKEFSLPFVINLNKDHWGSNGTWSFKKGEFRHATPEEIKKWKEENEIKLPKIADYSGMFTTDQAGTKVLKWGCTSISVSTVKELLGLNLKEITLDSHIINSSQIQQIEKYIERNKL